MSGPKPPEGHGGWAVAGRTTPQAPLVGKMVIGWATPRKSNWIVFVCTVTETPSCRKKSRSVTGFCKLPSEALVWDIQLLTTWLPRVLGNPGTKLTYGVSPESSVW